MILDRITINPNICLGQPTIRGMRITVSLILNLVANKMSFNDILTAYPELEEEEDILQSLRYASWISSEKTKIIYSNKAVNG